MKYKLFIFILSFKSQMGNCIQNAETNHPSKLSSILTNSKGYVLSNKTPNMNIIPAAGSSTLSEHYNQIIRGPLLAHFIDFRVSSSSLVQAPIINQYIKKGTNSCSYAFSGTQKFIKLRTLMKYRGAVRRLELLEQGPSKRLYFIKSANFQAFNSIKELNF